MCIILTVTPLSVLSGRRFSPTGVHYFFALITVSLLVMIGMTSTASAAETLIGSATLPHFKPETDSSGEAIGNGYEALHSGTVVTLEAYTAAEGTPSSTSVELGIYSGGSKPETLLGHCVDSTAAKKAEWLHCTGLSVTVTIKTKYWLAELSLGGNTQYEAVSGGQPAYGSKTFSKLEASATSWTERSAKGPAPFLALGEEKEIPTTTELAEKSLKAVEAITTEVKSLKSEVTALKTVLEGTIKVNCTTGCTGGGGGGGGEVTFSPAAQTNLSELKEGEETVGWCIIGTLLALAIAAFTFGILRARK
jgi:hypothetical protein